MISDQGITLCFMCICMISTTLLDFGKHTYFVYTLRNFTTKFVIYKELQFLLQSVCNNQCQYFILKSLLSLINFQTQNKINVQHSSFQGIKGKSYFKITSCRTQCHISVIPPIESKSKMFVGSRSAGIHLISLILNIKTKSMNS